MASTSNRPNPGRKRRRSPALAVTATIFKVLGTLLLIGLVTGAIMACFAAVYIKTVIIPQAHLDGNFDMNLTSTILYPDTNTGEYVEHLSLHGTENRKLVEYQDIPQDLINATVAIEDHRFWDHKGVDWRRTLNGVLLMFTGRDIQGGSTITQQLIKNFTQYDDVTVKRKILEIFRALDFDATYDKTQILEWYLNYIYLGDGCHGVATAAENYFGKELSELSLAECASLISITNNPSKYGPNSNLRITDPDTGEVKTARDFNKERQELVLYRMLELGMITQAEYDAAVAEELAFTRKVDEEKPAVVYNWYDEQVITDVIDDLVEQYGYSEKLASQMVTSGGLKIYACVDPRIQSIVEAVYTDRSNMDLTSDSGQQIQSAIVVLDPEGNVVGLAGALGEKEKNRVWNYASRSTRQPGSSIKPLSVYGPALELGLITPASVVDDYPVQLLNGSAWPVNSYSGFRGLMTVREAVEDSSNPVAVRTLQRVGFETSFQFMEEKFHIDLEEGVEINGSIKNDYGSSQLALGGLTNGVRVIDMAAAYATFPREGMYLKPRTYSLVTDDEGNVILDNTAREAEPVLQSTTAWYVNDLLKTVVQSGTGTQAKISGQIVAGKTGSTTSNCDRWFVGYTSYYTAAVWVGYDTPERIRVTPGSNPAAILWQKVMSQVHEGLESRDFNKPEGLTTIQYCLDSGMLATEACRNDPRGSRVGTATVFRGDGPTESCTLHTEVEVCTDSPVLDAGGSPVAGLYHLAGEFCPREAIPGVVEEPTVKTIAVLDLEREDIGGKTAKDSSYLKSYLEAQGTCDVHTSAIEVPPPAYDPYLFEITDPSTWPTQEQWPGFDPADEATWPVIPGSWETDPPVEPTGQPGDLPGGPPDVIGGGQPDVPPDDPYVPAGGTEG